MPRPQVRPYYMRMLPSAAALSLNFAIEQYNQPLVCYDYLDDVPPAKYRDMEQLDHEIQGEFISEHFAYLTFYFWL